MLRPAIVAAPGNVLIAYDWSAIEGRVHPWLSNCPAGEAKLDVFRSGLDPYKVNASATFRVPYAEVTGDQRQVGKVQELALGFLGGAGAFEAFSRVYGVSVDVKRAVDGWRLANPWAQQHGQQLESAYLRAMRNKGFESAGGRIVYLFDGQHLWYALPSGRVLCYPNAKFDDEGNVTYTKAAWKPAADAKEWPRARLWRGLACENVVQATANDIYNIGCSRNPRTDQLNCVRETVFRDVDFGSSMILGRMNRGVEVVYNGQKSGTVWALQPDTGRLLWRKDLGTGGALGGVHWGMAFWNDMVFAPISAPGGAVPGELPVDPNRIKSGLYALDGNTGEIKWSHFSTADCTGDRPQRMPACQRAIGFSTAPAVIDGVVVTAALDGYLYAFDGNTGRLLWKHDTARSYQGVNGVAGRGGAIDAVSITAASGLLIMNSGYGSFGQQAGNVLLAFKPKAR